jgi:hypothetical protein
MLGVLLATMLAAACADPPATHVAAGPRDAWHAAGIDSYTVTVDRMCFCPEVGPLTVTVAGDEVVSVRRRGEEIALDDPALESWPLTVEDLFDEVDDAERTADDVVVSYDTELGYPTRIAIDRWKNAVDDEVTFVARDLQVGAQASG